jgi:hypothetical protein
VDDDVPIGMSIQLLARLAKTVSGKKHGIVFHVLERLPRQKSNPWIVARLGADLQILIVGREPEPESSVWADWMSQVVETS